MAGPAVRSRVSGRRSAAAGLGNLLQNTKRRDVLTLLAESALTDADEYVRSSAYKSLQIVRGVTRDQHLKLLQSEDRSVDSSRVFSILRELK